MSSSSPPSSRIRLALVCCAIVANAICAGGIFTFPLLSPSLALHLKLTQPQLTTIVLAGMMGQYPFAAIVGNIIDRYGPWICSLASSCLFFFGFGMFSREISKTPDDITVPSQSSFHRLAVFFFLCGLGAVFSLFSSLFAASKNFPNHLGLASGTSMALFGLSPLFLSLLASRFFTDSQTGLDVTHFLTFLALLSGAVHLIGAFLLRVPSKEAPGIFQEDEEGPSSTDHTRAPSPSSTASSERQPLLSKSPQVDVEIVEVLASEPDGTLLDLAKDPYFWLLAMVTFCVLGACEMIISNIGTIVLSLPASNDAAGARVMDTATDVATSTQVRLISVANTLSRLVSGPLADYISPIASYLPSGVRSYPRKHIVSRVAFLTGSTLLLAAVFTCLELGIKTQKGLWLLSVTTGTAYGITFTILPSILSAVWGPTNMGRNFGIITYAAFVGTPFFSYLYAFVADHNSTGSGVCKGVQCWQFTFWVCVGTSVASCAGSGLLWRRWKGLV
ncbi:MFS general substrate transporter [Amylostereum chailletii]|nr:MFS general substrate transporter [Amylostereum chailletii]